MARESGRRLRVFNTHFDHVSPLARSLGARLILEQIHRFNQTDPLPTIVMGDFNAKPNSKAVRIMRENLPGYRDVQLQAALEQAGFHDIEIHKNEKDWLCMLARK